jgi:hypothetical protein
MSDYLKRLLENNSKNSEIEKKQQEGEGNG